MQDRLALMEADFEALVQHLSSLIDLHDDDPGFSDLERLRTARDRAAHAIELIRQSRGRLA